MRLVFVHGIAQEGKDENELKRVWLEALDVGLAKAGLGSIRQHEVVFPYYGDKLAELRELLKAPDSVQWQTKGMPASSSLDRTETELLREIIAEQFVDSDITQGVRTKGFENTELALALARAADRTPFGAYLIRFVKGVSAYLNHKQISQKIDEIVRPAIGTDPCVVVGHSLGSVVAFRVLRELGRSVSVERFVTLGSPLGLNTIRTLITPPALQVPAGVKSWTNAFDPKDVVSLHPLDRSTWNVNPAIVNIAGVENHTSNHHGISGYLDDAQVAGAIYEALQAWLPSTCPPRE